MSIRAHEWQRGSNVVHCCYGHGRGSEGVRDETSKFLARNTPAQPPRCAEGEAIDWVSLHCRLRPLLLNLRYPTLPSPSDQLPGLCLTAREPILAHPRPSHAQSGRPLPPSPSPSPPVAYRSSLRQPVDLHVPETQRSNVRYCMYLSAGPLGVAEERRHRTDYRTTGGDWATS